MAGYAGPGDIIDLSDSSDEMIRRLLERGQIETSDGTPINTPTGEVRTCANCNK